MACMHAYLNRRFLRILSISCALLAHLAALSCLRFLSSRWCCCLGVRMDAAAAAATTVRVVATRKRLYCCCESSEDAELGMHAVWCSACEHNKTTRQRDHHARQHHQCCLVQRVRKQQDHQAARPPRARAEDRHARCCSLACRVRVTFELQTHVRTEGHSRQLPTGIAIPPELTVPSGIVSSSPCCCP